MYFPPRISFRAVVLQVMWQPGLMCLRMGRLGKPSAEAKLNANRSCSYTFKGMTLPLPRMLPMHPEKPCIGIANSCKLPETQGAH